MQTATRQMSSADAEQMLDEYRRTVRNLFDTGSKDIISNASPRHAAILIEEMVRHANVSFRAFAGRMNPAVWNINVMDALGSAISRGVKVQLIVEHGCEPIANGSMPDMVRRAVRRFVVADGIDSRRLSHCATGDSLSFRLEMDPEKKTAVFAANNPALAARVAGVLDNLWEMSAAYAT